MTFTAYHSIYEHPVPEGHRFPMAKYSLIAYQLIREGIIEEKDIFEPHPAALSDILTTHEAAYVNNFIQQTLTEKEARRIGFQQSSLLIERERRLVQGTISGAITAAKHKTIAFNIAGGTHHACYAHGEGFCMLNDQAIAANILLKNGLAKNIMIIDLDVHQGNGTAQLFQHNSSVYTFSMHGKNNYPFRKEISDMDIPLADNITDQEYIQIMYTHLLPLIDKIQPDFIFYQSGVDILQDDKMGKLSCTLQGCFERDQLIFSKAAHHNIPIQCSMGGGYSLSLKEIVNAHVNTFLSATSL